MKASLAKILRIITVLIGIGTLALLLWEPHLEGRNAHATVFEIYFNDPFLAFAYTASIPFFVALHQIFKVLGNAGQGRFSSQSTATALSTIKYCAIALIGFAALGEIFILLSNSDDRAGGLFMGFLVALGSTVMGIVAARLKRRCPAPFG